MKRRPRTATDRRQRIARIAGFCADAADAIGLFVILFIAYCLI